MRTIYVIDDGKKRNPNAPTLRTLFPYRLHRIFLNPTGGRGEKGVNEILMSQQRIFKPDTKNFDFDARKTLTYMDIQHLKKFFFINERTILMTRTIR